MYRVKDKVFIFFCIAALSIALFTVHIEFERSMALLGIPENILVDELILFDNRSDFRESCGVAIFNLSKSTLDQIELRGLEFFKESTTGRDNEKYYKYDMWIQTPVSIPNVNVLRGLSCIKVDKNMVNSLWKAVETKNSYIGIGYEYDLLIIPKLGLIVNSVNG